MILTDIPMYIYLQINNI